MISYIKTMIPVENSEVVMDQPISHWAARTRRSLSCRWVSCDSKTVTPKRRQQTCCRMLSITLYVYIYVYICIFISHIYIYIRTHILSTVYSYMNMCVYIYIDLCMIWGFHRGNKISSTGTISKPKAIGSKNYFFFILRNYSRKTFMYKSYIYNL